MNGFWSSNNHRRLISLAIFLIVLGGVLSIIELLTENSNSIFILGLVLFILLSVFKAKFR
tara:strand:+ start:40 stop:219 length:180 start_codon:yes stop_codon:yes gene_type:complete